MSYRFQKYRNVIAPIFLYWIICALMFFSGVRFLYAMLAWNVFLSALPLLFINEALNFYRKDEKAKSIILTLLWLLFFPNSVYMITDFIHISNDRLVWFEEVQKYSASGGNVYNTDILAWLKFLVIGIGALYGVILGLESLYLFYRAVREKSSLLAACLSVGLVSLLSSFGVYIGRFLRFNSWDILNPSTLFQGIISGISPFAIQFTFGFAGFIVIIFVFYILLTKGNNNTTQE